MHVDPPRWSALARAATVDATVLEPRHIEFFGENDIVRCTRTGEMFRVETIEVDRCVVQRGIASEPVALKEGDELCIVGNAGRPV